MSTKKTAPATVATTPAPSVSGDLRALTLYFNDVMDHSSGSINHLAALIAEDLESTAGEAVYLARLRADCDRLRVEAVILHTNEVEALSASLGRFVRALEGMPA